MGERQKDLIEQVDEAFAEGRNQLGLRRLRQLSRERMDAEIYYRLAVIEEQIGTDVGARDSYLKCLSLAPNNPLAYLYTGYWFQSHNFLEEALSIYSLLTELSEETLSLWQDKEQSLETRNRSAAANKLVRVSLSAMHRASVGDGEHCTRIRQSIWTRTHDQPYPFAKAKQRPQLFYIPDIEAKAFESPKKHEATWLWLKKLEAAAPVIKKELLAVLPHIRDEGRPYLPEGIKLDQGFGPLVGSLNWTALDLYKEGALNHPVASAFPETLAALGLAGTSESKAQYGNTRMQSIPFYCLQNDPFEIFFSLLKAGQHIKPHYGLSNHSLTVHLPLIVPEDCWLRVGDETHHWQEGVPVVFDDTFDHEAYNGSSTERIVLIFSIWHPDLSIEEQQAVQRSFQQKTRWLAQRRVPAAEEIEK